MEDKLLYILITYGIIGVIFIGISIPLVLGKIPPNNYYGFRTQKTLSNPEIWYKVNNLTGKDLIKSGLIIVMGSVILWMEQKNLSFNQIVWIGLGIIIIPLVIAVLRGLLYISELDKQK